MEVYIAIIHAVSTSQKWGWGRAAAQAGAVEEPAAPVLSWVASCCERERLGQVRSHEGGGRMRTHRWLGLDDGGVGIGRVLKWIRGGLERD